MKTVRIFATFLVLLLFASPLRAEAPAALSSPQQLFADGLKNVLALFDATTKAHAVSTTMEIIKGDGLPKEFAGATVRLAFAAPDRLRVGTTINKQDFELGRDGRQIWIWEPAKNFGLCGVPGMAKFASAPEKLDAMEIGPIGLPLPRDQLALLPLLCSIEAGGDAELDGVKCRVLHVTPLPAARDAFKIAAIKLTFWLRASDSLPVQIEYADGKTTDVLVALHNLRVDAERPDDAFWRIPAAAENKVQRVALSHVVNFLSAALDVLNASARPLGPITGDKKILATYGRGRLEDHDGTKVLFLAGTPEEMGEQHGKLLKQQVRDLVSRVLYGVGVGSSFEKGRWFFGEIESCQARIDPFVDGRFLREMDAMARVSGCEKEEIRLANFFPELFHCSGFALMGEATAGGRIYHGRILDYMKGIGLEQNATVMVYRPDVGNAWVNVGYAGFVGTVTAMNEQHISIGEMGGRGEGNWDGKPMAQLLREVMEKASTLDEAIEIMRRGPRTCEYYYVIADGKSHTAVGLAATPETFEIVRPGESHPKLPTPVKDTVLMSAGDRYEELARRVQAGFGRFDADSARELMTRPVCMTSNIHSVLFAPDTLDFWVANADNKNVASHSRYTHYNLLELLGSPTTSLPVDSELTAGK